MVPGAALTPAQLFVCRERRVEDPSDYYYYYSNAFAISSLENPQILSQVVQSETEPR